MIKKALNNLLADTVNGKKYHAGGLIRDKKDARDFSLHHIGWSILGYTPQHDEWRINTISNKDQNPNNTCFSGDTEVLMSDFSYKPISSITHNEEVFSHLGKKQKVIKVMKRKWQGTTKLVKIFGDYEEIEVTQEHPFFAIKRENNYKEKNINFLLRSKAEFYPIKELKKHDWLALPFNNSVEDKTIYNFEKDPDFLWVLGLYLAEGSLSNSQVVFSLHREEICFYEKIKSTMEKYGATVGYSYKGDNGLTVYIANHYKWVKIFEELGGKMCDKKEINTRLMFLEPSLQIKIYEGMWNGDGWCESKTQRTISTSKKLLEQLRIILLRNGYYSCLVKRKLQENRKQTWELNRGLVSKYSFIKDNHCFVMIKQIKHKNSYNKGYVYNLEVANDNSYQVRNIAVHNCTQVSATVQKEVDEGVELDEQSLTCAAQELGFISGNGFSSLRWIQQAVQKAGIAVKGLLSGNKYNWASYSSPSNLTPQVRASAAEHKSSSFFVVNGRADRLQMLDKGRTLHTGLDWFQEYNISGGFSSPWLILGKGQVLHLGGAPKFSLLNWFKSLFHKVIGAYVGGHAVLMVGYKMNYHGYKVYRFQNSYGKDWGNNGDFYVEMDFFDREGYECYAQIDIPVDVVKFLRDNAGKNVRSAGTPAIWRIESGQKFAYPDWLTFLAYGGVKQEILTIDKSILDAVSRGVDMRIETSPYWSVIKEMSAPDNYKKLLELTAQGIPDDNATIGAIYEEMKSKS